MSLYRKIYMMPLLGLTAGSFAVLATGAASAAPADNTAITLLEHKAENSIFNFDYGPPSSPATTLLGLSADKSPPSTSLTKFVMSAPSLFNGSAGQSFAFDAAPGAFFGPQSDTTFNNYVNEGLLYRLGYRTRVGVAAMNGDAGKSVHSRLALGLSASLLDSADPLVTGTKDANGNRLLLGCLNALNGKVHTVWTSRDTITPDDGPVGVRKWAYERAWDDIKGDNPTAADYERARTRLAPYLPVAASVKLLTDSEFRAAVKKEVDLIDSNSGTAAEQNRLDAAQNVADDKAVTESGLGRMINNCAIAASRAARFSPDLDVGFGTLWRGTPGRLGDLKDGGQVAWLAYKYPFGVKFPQPDSDGIYAEGVDARVPKQAWMVVSSVRYARGEYLTTGDKATPEMRADTLDAWIGLERLSDDFRLAAQYGWLDVKARNALTKPFERSGERYLLSLQHRLHEGLWLGASYGNGYGTLDSLKANTALITLSFTPPAPPAITGSK